MKKKQIIGLVVAVGLFILTGMASVFTHAVSKQIVNDSLTDVLESGADASAPLDDYIAVIRVEGTIQEQTNTSIFDVSEGYLHTTTLNNIDDLIEDSKNKGILLYVDSPGGAVYESEELYLKLQEYKEKTDCPIWVYMAHYAASGGYLVSMPAEKIYANPNTTTGSIGVIMSGYDMTGLYEKLGIRYVSITSGENKDSSKMTDEQVAIYQEQVNEYYQRFVEIVSDGRDMSEKEVKKLADGRTYTAKQALKNGLIDEISLYDDMKDAMSKELGVKTFYEPERSVSLFSEIFAGVKNMLPKSEAQVLTETAAQMESGVPMYYAEQLQ